MDLSKIENLGIDRVLKRGSGEIIEKTDRTLFVRDAVSGAYLLACDDIDIGIELLDRYRDDLKLLMVSNYSLGLRAFERYGFSTKLECYQFAYYGEKPRVDSELTFRTADMSDLDMIASDYSMISRDELAQVIERQSLIIGYYRGNPVGFIGEHLEGSIGLLYVFPEYRRRGFGTDLELCYIAKTMEKGFIPFGQVEKNNEKSLGLQKKIGMTRSDNLIVWMWK